MTLGSHIIELKSTASTNKYAVKMLEDERPEEGTVIITDEQTAGTGTDANLWESEPGKNLTFSLIIYPDSLHPEKQFYLNKVFSLGLYDSLKEILPKAGISVKWPNDIYIEDKKVAGILIRNSIRDNTFIYSVIGIGVNVNQKIFRSDAPNPVSLKPYTGHDLDLKMVLQHVCKRCNERLLSLYDKDFRKLDRDYLRAQYRFGEYAEYIFQGKKIMASIRGVSEFGKLILELSGGRFLECDLKEVEFVL